MRPLVLIASLALAGSATGQSAAPAAREPAQPSRDEILALPTREVARALFGGLASQFATMTIERNGDVPVFVSFATEPRSTGLPGLCEATTMRFFLVREENRAAPAAVRSQWIDTVYKVIGEVDGPLGPLGPRGHEQARRCAATGPVLPAPSEDRRAARFFSYRGHGVPWLGVAALQDAIRKARAGHYGPIECTRRELADCRDPRADLAALDLRNLESVDVIQPDAEQPDFIVHARFVAEPNLSFGWQVSLDFNGEPLPVPRSSVATFNLGRTRLYRY